MGIRLKIKHVLMIPINLKYQESALYNLKRKILSLQCTEKMRFRG